MLEREREVERYLVKACEAEGWDCVKFIPDLNPGWPDRLVLLPRGRCAWVELKREAGRLSPLQEYTHTRLGAKGQCVYVAWSREDVDRIVGEMKKS